ncbi:Serine/threonine-protein kinase Nek4 [Oryzias melastigma]|uniref:non-specific serine/threonine protein kinase n=1 Tax=Oryzias melastigma TaxID=30732 RepID=A0A834BKA3_ORYME|nr:serine/threonine-protein kinase Tao-like [Oryzias melastigma]KAF6714823.1 Serine/threonine-protein kinase Nek4 [Oryzias melastigma]
MGNQHSSLQKEGYKITKETDKYIIVTKDFDIFFIKKLHQKDDKELASSNEALKKINHSHLLDIKGFKGGNHMSYMIMEYCQGGSLAKTIRKEHLDPFKEQKILSWFVEIIMALKALHEKGSPHKDLTPENVFLNKFGIIRMGGFGITSESGLGGNQNKPIHYLPPETLTGGIYEEKSDIWSAGCILFELCTKQPAFSADTPVNLIPKIISGPSPSLPEGFSPELCKLLSDMLEKNPENRPTAGEILAHPFVQTRLIEKCKTTVEELQTILNTLRALADGLENVHTRTCIGSLTGGVIGLLGGITTIVGVILSPFTLGASIIVTGVGAGVGAVGGITASASNITKTVKQTSQREAVDSIIKEFDQKTKAVVTWLQEIYAGLETIGHINQQTLGNYGFNNETLKKAGFRAGRSLGVVSEAVRLGRFLSIGQCAAQTSRVVRVAGLATGILSGIFVAVDVFFIAMDAKEIHHIRQAKASTASDQNTLMSSPETEYRSSSVENIKSEIMKFVKSIRNFAGELQKVVDELKNVISTIPEKDPEEEQDGITQNVEGEND